jgi:predicted MFS family arabinose efflux permease
MNQGFGVGWRQVAASFALMAAASMIASAYGVMAVPFAHEFHPSRMVLMLTITVVSAVSGLTSPLFGSLLDRKSVRLLMIGGALSLVAGLFALSFATSFAQVLVIYAVLMAPANILIGPMAAAVLLSRWFVRRRGAALGLAIAGVATGTFLYNPLIQALLNHFDWRTAFRLLALITFLLTVPFAALVINRPAERGLHPDGADRDPQESHVEAPRLSTGTLLSDPTFWLAVTIFSVVLSGMIGMISNLVPMAHDVGFSANAAALLASCYAIGGICAKLSFAVISDRMNLRHLMFLSLSGFACGMACLIRPEIGYWLVAVGATAIGFFGGFMVPFQGFFIARVFGAHVVGRVLGLLNVFTLAVMLVTPPLFGRIFDVTGSYGLIFVIFTALAAGAMLLVPHVRIEAKPAPAYGGGDLQPEPAE